VVRFRGIAVPIGSHANKTIILGADHRGVRLKNWLKPRLRRMGFRVRDVGVHSTKRCDYPLVAARIAGPVGRTLGRDAVGIGICGSGIGISVAAGKIPGVHPAMPSTVAAARETRTHNNTNFLALSADWMTPKRALAVTAAWLTEAFFTDPRRDAPYLRRFVQTVNLERARRR
jgi:ribose 5-phosphate isomerase B